VIFADVESRVATPENGKQYFTPFLWTAIYVRYRKDLTKRATVRKSGTEISTFWDFVEAHTWGKRKTYLTTHHLEPDMIPLQMFSELIDRGWLLDKFIYSTKVVMLFWSKGSRKLMILNNGNLFPGSIAQWGKMLKLPKLPMPSQDAPMTDWVTYCFRDVEVMVAMWDTLLTFLDVHDLGNFKHTVATMAKNAFVHRFMDIPICVHHHKEAMQLERDAYRGGRCEATQVGDFTDGPFYYLDINSGYANIGISYPMPYMLKGYLTDVPVYWIKHLLKHYAVIADVTVDIVEPCFPIVVDTKNQYPTGVHRTSLSTPELIYALQRGWIKKAHRVAYYKHDKVFKAFMQYFTDLKQEYSKAQNWPMRAVAKLYPNAVFGKMGQKGYTEKVVGECDPKEIGAIETWDADTHKPITYLKYGGKIRRVTVEGNAYDAFVAIALHSTSYCRMLLWRLMKKAGLENVYHVATDSLIVNQAGYEKLIDEIVPFTPGKLKVEKIMQTVSIKGRNDVIEDGVEKIKGVNKKALKTGPNTYVNTEWPRMVQWLKHKWPEKYFTRVRVKTLKREAYKLATIPGYVLPSRGPKKTDPWQYLTEFEANRAFQLEWEIAAMREARRVPARIVFKLYDYRTGFFKRQRDRNGELVAVEYSSADTWPSELGFNDLDELLKATLAQITVDHKIAKLEYQLDGLLDLGRLRVGQPQLLSQSQSGAEAETEIPW